MIFFCCIKLMFKRAVYTLLPAKARRQILQKRVVHIQLFEVDEHHEALRQSTAPNRTQTYWGRHIAHAIGSSSVFSKYTAVVFY